MIRAIIERMIDLPFMAVKIGSARIDENGKAHGGKAGDQTGKEVSTQNWYLNSKGWRVYRAKNPAVAEKIAQCMERACANSAIGYDQYHLSSIFASVYPVTLMFISSLLEILSGCLAVCAEHSLDEQPLQFPVHFPVVREGVCKQNL